MAGLSPHVRVVRAMPNTASSVLEGATALAGGPDVTEEQMRIAQAVFEAVGQVVVVHESHLDAVTGLSGGGVAYVYAFIEALADGGVKMGLSRAHAQLLAAQTVLGAGKDGEGNSRASGGFKRPGRVTGRDDHCRVARA